MAINSQLHIERSIIMSNLSAATLKSRNEYLADAAAYLRLGQEIPNFLLEKLGLGPRKSVIDTPDTDSFIDAMDEYHKYMIKYHMLEEEIRMSCNV